MSKLDNLVEEWFEEREAFKRVEIRFLAFIKVFAKLNKEIYIECQKQGIDIDSLKLNQ